VEGTSGRHEPSPFTRRWSRRPWRLPHAGKRYGSQEPKLTKVERRLHWNSAKEGEATEVSEARSRQAPWEETPTLSSLPTGHGERRREAKIGSVCLATIRRSVRECRETLGPPVVLHGAQDSVGCPRDESRGVSWERTRYGCTQIVQVAEVGRTHRASCPPKGRKARWRARALARRNLEIPTDAGSELRYGETVRGRAFTIKSTRWFGLWVSARRFSIRRKMFSGLCPSHLHR